MSKPIPLAHMHAAERAVREAAADIPQEVCARIVTSVMSRFDPGSSRRLVSGRARELAVGVREVSDKNVKRGHARSRRQEIGSNRARAVAAAPIFAGF